MLGTRKVNKVFLLGFKKKTLWPLFKGGVQLPQGYSHFEEAVYFLPLSSQKFLVLIYQPQTDERLLQMCLLDISQLVLFKTG